MSFSINKNSQSANQVDNYTFEKVKGQKSLNIKKKNGTSEVVANVTCHNTFFHKGDLVKVKADDGKKYYIKQADFNAAIGSSGVSINRNNNNNNNNNVDNSNQNVQQQTNIQNVKDAINQRPYNILKPEYRETVRENPGLFVDAVVLQYASVLRNRGEQVSEEDKEIFKTRLNGILDNKPEMMESFS